MKTTHLILIAAVKNVVPVVVKRVVMIIIVGGVHHIAILEGVRYAVPTAIALLVNHALVVLGSGSTVAHVVVHSGIKTSGAAIILDRGMFVGVVSVNLVAIKKGLHYSAALLVSCWG